MGTAEQIRAATLEVWRAQPSRLREDANSEEDATRALGGRVLVELVQNALDADGTDAVVRVEHADGALRVLDRGSGLTVEGLRSLCSLRASAKERGVGRFGTGFAAVLALTDRPEIHSSIGSFTWSAELTREVTGAQGHVPVLRLPFDCAPRQIPQGWTTMVHLPLRPGAQVPEVDASLPLTMPGLHRLELPDRVLEVERSEDSVTCDGVIWRQRCAQVDVDPALQSLLPLEQRLRAAGEIRVLTPVGPWPTGVARVLHAPQPTDVPISLPLLVSAPFSIAPDRRRVEQNAHTDWLVEQVADLVVQLIRDLSGDPAVLDLVPVGFPASELDGQLRSAVLDRLESDPPVRGCVLDLGDVPTEAHLLVSAMVDDLLPATWPVRHPALTVLGIRRLDTSDVVELVARSAMEPAALRQVYAVLQDAPDREALAALPVPLADGRTVTGARGAWLPGPLLDPLLAAGVALRVIHPDAVHPLLERLGAAQPSASALLDEAAVREAVLEEESEELADAVLSLVAVAGPREWLADLVLRDDQGDPACAVDLVLPDSPLEGLLTDPLPRVSPALLERWGPQPLIDCGVGSMPRLTHDDLDPAWTRQLPAPVPDAVGIADLDVLRWPDALRVISEDPALRSAVVAPLRCLDGSVTRSPAAWWISCHPVLDGRLPGEILGPGADPLLAGVYDPAPSWLDSDVAEAIGCVHVLPDSDEGWWDVADRIGDSDRELELHQVMALYSALALAAPEGEPPRAVRALMPDGTLACVPPSEAVVGPGVSHRPVVPVSQPLALSLARVLGVALSGS